MSAEVREVAQTILQQISTATKMACGVRSMVCGVTTERLPYLQMRVGAAKSFQYIKVCYMPNDTYTVVLSNTKRGYEVDEEEHEDVYCEQLSSIIYSMVNK